MLHAYMYITSFKSKSVFKHTIICDCDLWMAVHFQKGIVPANAYILQRQ